MRRFNDLVQWHKASGQPVVVHDLTLTPQSQVLIVRFPWGAWVWHRPTAIQVERNGRVERLPIVDLTRLIQLGLVGLLSGLWSYASLLDPLASPQSTWHRCSTHAPETNSSSPYRQMAG